MSTKSQQVAQLLLRPEGCSYSDALAITGWPSISIQWHARNNGLRLRVEKINGHGRRYFGERRKIEVRKVVRPQVTPLAASCAAHDFTIVDDKKGRALVCQHCYLGFRIYQKHESENPWLTKHMKQHADIHRHHNRKQKQ